MTRDPRYDPLFEPIQIGPVTAPNRFYQVPHCSGMGYQRPQMLAAMRAVKAEGGWGVVCTEYCSIDVSSDEGAYPNATLRDDDDVRNLRLMTDAVHAQGSLAGVELWYGGRSTSNVESREISLDVGSYPSSDGLRVPGQSQAMDADDILRFRQMHVDAAHRALNAGSDIVYVYANHYYMLHNFINPELNRREDEYGGAIENRIRLVREVIEDVAEVIAGKAALAVRYSMPLNLGDDPQELIAGFKLIAELPDLWDITVHNYYHEMGSSRFIKEAANQAAVALVKSMTSKPVVSVGRFTSPDTMLSQITNGVQDFIGAARPSIADPFLPNKIKQGRLDDIRECIGCNICYAHNSIGATIRCTQNPTMGEEWRRGWHPDRIEPRHADESVLVVGGGPAGLEAARALGQRGYRVALAEAEAELGGRVNHESRLPGLSEWVRVRDWRVGQLAKMPEVEIYLDNRLDADAIIGLDHQHVILATGSHWRCDGVGRYSTYPFIGHEQEKVYSPDQVMLGDLPSGRLVIYDDDHYYLASALALFMRASKIPVTLVTPEPVLAEWNYFTEEHGPLMTSLLGAGVEIVTGQELLGFESGIVQLECAFSGVASNLEADSLLPVTSRIPDDSLWQALRARRAEFEDRGGLSLQRIGDCRAPGIIAAAVYAGHKAARELGAQEIKVKRDRVVA